MRGYFVGILLFGCVIATVLGHESTTIRRHPMRHAREKHVPGDPEDYNFGKRRSLLPLRPVVPEGYKVDELTPDELTPKRFFQEYVARSRPVVIKGLVRKWPAFRKWKNEFIRKRVGKVKVPVEMAKDNQFHFYGTKYKQRNLRISEFLDKCFSNNSTFKYYIAQVDIEETLPELYIDIRRPPMDSWLQTDEILFWMGRGGQVTPLHFDESENIMGVVSGRKKFVLYDPGQTSFLYPIARGKNSALTSQLNIEQPDLEKYPLFRHARAITLEVSAGDAFYLPSYWWHQVYSFGRNIAVNYWYDIHSKMTPKLYAGLTGRMAAIFKNQTRNGLRTEKKSGYAMIEQLCTTAAKRELSALEDSREAADDSDDSDDSDDTDDFDASEDRAKGLSIGATDLTDSDDSDDGDDGDDGDSGGEVVVNKKNLKRGKKKKKVGRGKRGGERGKGRGRQPRRKKQQLVSASKSKSGSKSTGMW